MKNKSTTMDDKRSFYVISNGSSETYPNNTLTKFTNRFPAPIDLQGSQNYEVAVESIGFSCLFRNIKLPENKSVPSFILTNQFFIDKTLSGSGNCAFEGQEINEVCSKPKPLEMTLRHDSIKRLFNKLIKIEEINPVEKQKKTEGSETEFVLEPPPPFYYFGRFEEKYYTQEELTEYFTKINEKYALKITFKDGLLDFSRPIDATVSDNFYEVYFHSSMLETFGFESSLLLEYEKHFKTPRFFDSAEMVAPKRLWKKKTLANIYTYDGELYFKFTVGAFENTVRATKSPISKMIFPHVVKVVSNNIYPQIFNSSYSNDMVVFCPDFKNNDDYYFHEFESRQYVPLLNSSLTDFEIKLCDEDNNQLQLLPGVPSFLKINIRKMSDKSTFNVRLTSAKSKAFPDNTSQNFRIKLPNVLSLDKRWRVALTSISHPNTFNTFLPEKNSRGIIVKQIATNIVGRKVLSDIIHTPETILSELNEVFSNKQLGEVTIDAENKLKFKFWKESLVGISTNLLRVLGYNEPLNLNEMITTIPITQKNLKLLIGKNEDDSNNYTLLFNNPINVNALRPNYIIAYTNFIESTIIGGIYSKILRVIPVSSKEKGYIISDFKHKEFLELQNTEISEIEIVLRSHDGAYIYFGTNEEVILNLEFTTDDEIMVQ